MVRPFRFILSLLALSLLTGCSTYVDEYEYLPSPVLAEAPPLAPDQTPPASMMASVIGVRRDDPKSGIPASVEVRLRLENSDGKTVAFDPRTLDLINGALWKFPPPIVQPSGPVMVPPEQSVVVSAYFPLPPGQSWDDVYLGSLQLRWRIKVDGRDLGQAAYFHRIARLYFHAEDPFWEYPFYGGPYRPIVIVHQGR